MCFFEHPKKPVSYFRRQTSTFAVQSQADKPFTPGRLAVLFLPRGNRPQPATNAFQWGWFSTARSKNIGSGPFFQAISARLLLTRLGATWGDSATIHPRCGCHAYVRRGRNKTVKCYYAAEEVSSPALPVLSSTSLYKASLDGQQSTSYICFLCVLRCLHGVLL